MATTPAVVLASAVIRCFRRSAQMPDAAGPRPGVGLRRVRCRRGIRWRLAPGAKRQGARPASRFGRVAARQGRPW